jgi:hypothetical protein
MENKCEACQVANTCEANMTGELCTYQPKSSPAKLLGETVLSELEQDACTPTKEQLDAYLATPDDEIAAQLRKELTPDGFRGLGRYILYGINIAHKQDAYTRSELEKRGWKTPEEVAFLVGNAQLKGEQETLQKIQDLTKDFLNTNATDAGHWKAQHSEEESCQTMK